MNEWVCSNGGMILTGKNWGTKRGKLDSVGDRKTNEYVAIVKCYWQGKLKYWKRKIIQPLWYMNEWVWSYGGMILGGENRSTGREILYSVCGRWMNEYWAMVEWYWQGRTEVLGEEHYTASVVDEWKNMQQWWNDWWQTNPNDIYDLISYRAVNTLRLVYKNLSVNAVGWNNRCLISGPHKSHQYTVWAERRVFEC
jgi:hypothetical protein